jgi:hypothetical protein
MRLIWKLAGLALLVLGMAMYQGRRPGAPEIDPSAGVNALALVSGVLLILRSRKR